MASVPTFKPLAPLTFLLARPLYRIAVIIVIFVSNCEWNEVSQTSLVDIETINIHNILPLTL